MAINFPTSLDTLTNPGSGDNLNTAGVVHDVQHADVNDIAEALEAKVGADSSAVATSHDYKIAKLSTRADILGNGGNGSLTFDGAATILGMVPAGNLYTMTRPIFASSITVNAGVTVRTAGYRIFCTGTVTVASTGVIHNNGINGNAGSGASAGGVVSGQTNVEYGDVPNSLAGTNGTTGASTTGGTTTGPTSMGGGGGGGGGGGDSSGGGTAAAGSSGARVLAAIEFLYELLRGFRLQTSVTTFVGAAGGRAGRGAGDGSNSGGGGAGGPTAGGTVVIAASAIANSGTISANGGNGATGGVPPAGNCGGGGGSGGGGGGVIVLAYKTLTNSGTISANGGTLGNGGAGVGTGTTGLNGINGEAGTVLKFNLTTGAWE